MPAYELHGTFASVVSVEEAFRWHQSLATVTGECISSRAQADTNENSHLLKATL